MNQQDMNKIMAGERVAELERLHTELNKMKWSGSDEGWDLAIEAVRKHIGKRSIELIHKHIPEAITADIGGNA